MKYVKRDEIIKAVKEAMCPMDYPSELRDSIARTIVSASESIDIVHCKDCEYYEHNRYGTFCNNVYGLHEDTDGDDYCSYGERKEQEHD